MYGIALYCVEAHYSMSEVRVRIGITCVAVECPRNCLASGLYLGWQMDLCIYSWTPALMDDVSCSGHCRWSRRSWGKSCRASWFCSQTQRIAQAHTGHSRDIEQRNMSKRRDGCGNEE